MHFYLFSYDYLKFSKDVYYRLQIFSLFLTFISWTEDPKSLPLKRYLQSVFLNLSVYLSLCHSLSNSLFLLCLSIFRCQLVTTDGEPCKRGARRQWGYARSSTTQPYQLETLDWSSCKSPRGKLQADFWPGLGTGERHWKQLNSNKWT